MKFKGFLIDLDGTTYLGNQRIDSASAFVNRLVELNIPFLFVSNNSSKSQEDVCTKLVQFGYHVTKDHVYTSAMATQEYLKQFKNQTCYVIGDNGLKECVKNSGLTVVDDSTAEIVVVGYNNKLSYDHLKTACLAISNGAKFISTNPDIALPTDEGLIPGNGSITAAIATATSSEPIFIGKPSNIIMDYAIKHLGIKKSELCMIGDNYDTDIMAGINAEIATLYVETGLTTKSQVLQKHVLPTIMLQDLSHFDWDKYL